MVAQVAQGGDGDHDRVAAHDVAADHGRARDLTFVAQAVHEFGGPGDGEFGGDDEAEEEGGGDRAHGGDVGEVLRGGLAADVVRRRPVAAEVTSFEQDVRAGHHAPVGGGDDRGVVAGPDPYRRGGGEPGRELSDEPELAQLSDCALHRVSPRVFVPAGGRGRAWARRGSRAVTVLGTVK